MNPRRPCNQLHCQRGRKAKLEAQLETVLDLLQKGGASMVYHSMNEGDVERATFIKPHAFPSGFRYVLVNGTVVIEDEKHTGARPGRILLGPAAVSAR